MTFHRREFWVEHRGEIGYLIGAVAVTIALVGQCQNNDAIREQNHRLAASQRIITQQQEVVRHQARLGAQTHVAVCAFRDEHVHQTDQTRAFIRAHPNGIPGVSVKELRVGLKTDEATIIALSSLRCP